MSEETLRILKLLEAGKITSKEAEDLLGALKAPAAPQQDEDNGYLYQYHGPNPAKIVARVIREVDPAGIAAEAIERAREKMERAQEKMELLRAAPLPPEMPRMPRMPKMPRMPEMPECCFGSNSAEEEQVVTVPAEGITAIALNQPRSEIKAAGTDSDQIVIRAEVQVYGDDEEEAQERLKSLKVTAENDNGTLRVKLEGPPWTKKRRAQVDFELEVPKRMALDLGTASGDVEVADVAGGTKVQSASGEITLERCDGAIELSTASGDVGLKELSLLASVNVQTASGDIEIDSAGKFTIRSVSGDITAEVPAGTFKANSVSGDIELDNFALEEIVVSTTSGDIDVKISSTPEARVQLESVSGDIAIELPDKPQATIDAATTSGDIDCDLELAERNQTSRRLSGKIGQGNARITVRTTSGDIDIE